jgi:hypothetical protein
MMFPQATDINRHRLLRHIGLVQPADHHLRLLTAKIRHPRVHVRPHAAVLAPQNFFKPAARQFAAHFVECRRQMRQLAQRFRCRVVHAEILRPWIFRTAFAIAIMAGVAVQPRHLPVHLLLRRQLGCCLFLNHGQRQFQRAFLQIVQIKARRAAGLFFSEAALVGRKRGQ